MMAKRMGNVTGKETLPWYWMYVELCLVTIFGPVGLFVREARPRRTLTTGEWVGGELDGYAEGIVLGLAEG
jgi:hypothetical protein